MRNRSFPPCNDLSKEKSHVVRGEFSQTSRISVNCTLVQIELLFLQGKDSLLNRVLHDEASRSDGLVLTETVRSINCLLDGMGGVGGGCEELAEARIERGRK